VVSCGRKKFRVSFSGTAVGASASPSAAFGRWVEGNSGGLSVEETCGVNFLRNSARAGRQVASGQRLASAALTSGSLRLSDWLSLVCIIDRTRFTAHATCRGMAPQMSWAWVSAEQEPALR
jgi:hypothetical protein